MGRSFMMAEIANWDSFYVMVGTAAGALIGLQFVVLTLLAERPPKGASEVGAAFLTPTIVHFGVTVLLSALLLAPWQTMGMPAALLGVIGFSGVVYIGMVALRMRRLEAYHPELEDWLFHVVLPLAAYIVLFLSLFTAPSHLHEVLFGVGAATLLLLFVGIHNAWDNIAYTVFVHNTERNERKCSK
jgi:hypothetical protein